MFSDWFRALELRMAFSDFERLPRNPAYKYEFLRDRAVLTPRPRYERVVLDLSMPPRVTAGSGLPPGPPMRPLQADDWTALPGLLALAFGASPPLVTLDAPLRLTAARECVEFTRGAGDGTLVEPACFVSVEPHANSHVRGAVIITLINGRDHHLEDEQIPHLTWIFVHPYHTRHGLGAALLDRAVSALSQLGYRNLASTFLVGNDRATLWHWRRGFRLV
jgi:ribosomal protein S18 acetylase RimI-like enzyme